MRVTWLAIAFWLPLSAGSLAAEEPEWLNLFADGTFSQWQQISGKDVGKGWTIKDGVVHRQALMAGNIVTREKFRNFELEFEWKISEGGNSGIKYRTRKSLGLEYQVLDDAKHKDGKIPSHRTASLYDLLAAPDEKPVHEVGQWNRGRIKADGNLIEHWLNGELVIKIEIGSADWQERFQKSKYKKHEGFGTWEGPILLQDHGDQVWYRNLKVRKLESK